MLYHIMLMSILRNGAVLTGEMLFVIIQVFYKNGQVAGALLTVSDIALNTALSVVGRTPSRRGSATRSCTAYALEFRHISSGRPQCATDCTFTQSSTFRSWQASVFAVSVFRRCIFTSGTAWFWFSFSTVIRSQCAVSRCRVPVCAHFSVLPILGLVIWFIFSYCDAVGFAPCIFCSRSLSGSAPRR